MFKWLKKKSIENQKRNIEFGLKNLIEIAHIADKEIAKAGSANEELTEKVVGKQKSLLTDMIGPLSKNEIKKEFFDPILNSSEYSNGVKMAVEHVLNSFKE